MIKKLWTESEQQKELISELRDEVSAKDEELGKFRNVVEKRMLGGGRREEIGNYAKLNLR